MSMAAREVQGSSRPRIPRRSSSKRGSLNVNTSSRVVPDSASPSPTVHSPLPSPLLWKTKIESLERQVESLDDLRKDMPGRIAGRGPEVRRWDGVTKTHTEWDGLRRDSELWFEDGDCLVHLYSKGQSRRGPSFRVTFDGLRETRCGALFSLCFAQTNPHTPTEHQETFFHPATPGKYELYIPAPDNAAREEAFQWHLTTRNFFAWMFGKPLVGVSLGKSLVALLERLHLYRADDPASNCDEFMSYATEMGYLDFNHCPDHALAFLHFADYFQTRQLWIDAFAHCVGMNEELHLSSEFENVNRVTQALITRAYLEMDLRLDRASRSLRTFAEEELSAANLGISNEARAHLDGFRSFLHAYYVGKFGYWPPPKGQQFPKALYKSMYFEFRNLYDYLADTDSSESLRRQKPASGGICVLQNITALNKRQKLDPLPYPLPLLPDTSTSQKQVSSQRGLLAMKLGGKPSKSQRAVDANATLLVATNSDDATVMGSNLVKAYRRFEKEWTLNKDERISVSDSRKIRWIVIYAVLQILVSVTRAPAEVRDCERAAYPLCCLTAGTPPWTMQNSSPPQEWLGQDLLDNELSPPKAPQSSVTPEPTVKPDCDAPEYFKSTSRTTSTGSAMKPTPLRVGRNSTVASRVSSRRSSITKATVALPAQGFCEIIVHGYGNGLNPASVEGSYASSPVLQPTTPTAPTSHKRKGRPLPVRTTAQGSSAEPISARTPILEDFHLDPSYHQNAANDYAYPTPSSSGSVSTSAPLSPMWSDHDSSSSSDSEPDFAPSRYKTRATSMGLNSVSGSMSSRASRASTPPLPSSFSPTKERSRMVIPRKPVTAPLTDGLAGSASRAKRATVLFDMAEVEERRNSRELDLFDALKLAPAVVE